MPPIEPAEYFADRAVEHVAQGDIFEGTPAAATHGVLSEEPSSGARKRPASEDNFTLTGARFQYGIVCSYTCGFTAQPPGTRGYAHPYRIVAPIVSLGELRASGVTNNDLRKLQRLGGLQGLMWLPLPIEGEPASTKDEFVGQSAVLLYRPSLVTQSALDQCRRARRLSEMAQRLLIAGLIQVISPNNFDPFDDGLVPPDMSDGWTAARR